MTDTNNTIHNYSTGVPRHHHNLYLEDGNFVIQVENAIFKVHRYFLAKYSTVISDMFDSPQESGDTVGTDDCPLALTGDAASGWELLLEEIYDRSPLENSKAYNAEHLLSLLRIAHKYCMDRLEQTTLEKLQQNRTTGGYIDLIVAAQIVGSDPLYQQALQSSISSNPQPDLAQAKRIGTEAYYAITASTISAIHTENAAAQALARGDLASARADLASARSDLALARADLAAVRLEAAAAKTALVTVAQSLPNANTGRNKSECKFSNIMQEVVIDSRSNGVGKGVAG